jgi:ribonuclease H / adenosylcobalamin/alpha-ribazole phosphatase
VSRRLVVEADGGSRGNPGPAAYGALVRDPETGVVLAERAQYLGVTTNNVAEYSGLVAGLTAAKEIDPDAQVEVRLDSKLVVEQMTGRWKIKHEDMRRLALEARAILPVEQVTYEWVPRLQNSAADRLANAAMDAAARGQTWEPSSTAYPGVVSEPTTDPGSEAPRLSYRLLTGEDTAEFCARVSAALAEGYQLHGSPAVTYDGTKTIVAQALVDPRMLGFGT